MFGKFIIEHKENIFKKQKSSFGLGSRDLAPAGVDLVLATLTWVSVESTGVYLAGIEIVDDL